MTTANAAAFAAAKADCAIAKKQTAANNSLLRNIKRGMNEKVYKKASEIMNAQGTAATLAYLQTFFSRQVSIDFFRNFLT